MCADAYLELTTQAHYWGHELDANVQALTHFRGVEVAHHHAHLSTRCWHVEGRIDKSMRISEACRDLQMQN